MKQVIEVILTKDIIDISEVTEKDIFVITSKRNKELLNMICFSNLKHKWIFYNLSTGESEDSNYHSPLDIFRFWKQNWDVFII